MKRQLTMMLALVCSLWTWAADGDSFTAKTDEGVELNYKVISEADKTCMVAKLPSKEVTAVVVPETVNGYTVTEVGKEAFSYRSIQTCVLPNTITRIGSMAFQVSSLSEIDIPQSVTAIDSYAFDYCSHLTSIVVPDGVQTLGDHVFRDCSKLTSVVLPQGLEELPIGLFQKCTALEMVTIPTTVTVINSEVFWACRALKSVDIPSGVTAIGSSSFYFCTSLSSIVLPEGVTSIGNDAFQGCTALESINIPSTVQTIGDKPFQGCTSLKHISINTAEVGTWFKQNTSLETVELGDAVTSIGAEAFYGCTSLQTINLTEQITTIGKNAFNNCTALKSVGIINTPKVDSWFSGKSNLESVTFGSNVTEIVASAFQNCESLKEITLPATLTSIGISAFSSCLNLGRVYAKMNPPIAVQRAFNWSVSVLIVPQGTRSDYKSLSGWSGAVIFEEGETVYDKKYTDAQGVVYTLNQSNGKIYYSATGHTDDLATELTFPADIDGCPVATVSSGAFSDCTVLKKVTFPDGMTEISFYAFNGCISLKEFVSEITDPTKTSVSIPQEVYERAHLIVPAGTRAAYVKAGWGRFTIFEQGETVVDYDRNPTDAQGVKYTLRQNESGAYYAVTGHSDELAERVTIPESVNGVAVTAMESGAFKNCTGLKWIFIPETVTSFCNGSYRDDIFGGCSLTLALNQKTVSGWKQYKFITGVELGSAVDSLDYEAFYMCPNLKTVTFAEGCRAMANEAFGYCSALESVTLPKSLKVIPRQTFYYCTALVLQQLPASVAYIGSNAFSGCSIRDVTIGPNTEVAYNAFSGCKITNVAVHTKDFGSWLINNKYIKKVYVGSEVETYGGQYSSNALQGCSGIEVIEVDAANSVFDSRGDCNAIIQTTTNALLQGCNTTVIPETVTSIGAGAFSGYAALTEVTLPATLTSIGRSAFSGCTGLQRVTSNIKSPFAILAFDTDTKATATLAIPFGTTYYYNNKSGWDFTTIEEFGGTEEERTFIEFADAATKQACVNNWDANHDGEISLAEAKEVTEVKGFGNCNSMVSFDELQYFTNVTTIANQAFNYCTSLTSITLPESVTTIGENAFQGCSSLAAITIPAGVSAIGRNAFYDCKSLTTANLPDSVTAIGAGAFQNCTALTAINLPEGLTAIGGCAFSGSGLREMTLPSTLTSLGDYSLAGQEIHCRLTTPITVGELMYNAADVVLYVPQGCQEAFSKAYGWNYFMIVEEGSGTSIDWADGQVTVTLDEAGDLRLALIELDDEEITRLKIVGPMNSTDLKYLVDGKGKIANLESLDLSGVQLVYDGGCYREGSFSGISDTGFESRYSYYYLTEEEDYKKDYVMGISPKYYYYYYGPNLAGAFADKPYKHVVMPPTVTKAASSVFSGCTNLQQVEFPAGIGDVAESAFAGCERLRSISLAQTDTIGSSAFSGCKMLQAVEGLEHVRYIDYSAFKDCRLLSDLSLSDQLDYIGQYAFSGCRKLTQLTLPDGLTGLESYAFADCVSLQEVNYGPALTHVNYTCFRNTPWLKTLPSEDGVKYMGTIALSYDEQSGVVSSSGATLSFREGTTAVADLFGQSCSNFAYVAKLSLPASLRRIGTEAFNHNNLTTLSLPDGLEEIGESAFSSSAQLTKVTLPESLMFIGNNAFAGSGQLTIINYNCITAEGTDLFQYCTSIEKVNVGDHVQLLPDGVFSGCTALTVVKFAAREDAVPVAIGNEAFARCENLASINLPTTTSAIGEGAFSGCKSLTAFTVPGSVTTLSARLLAYCTGLTSVTLHDGITVIGDEAFSDCSSLTAVELPAGLQSLGSGAFSGCLSLAAIELPASIEDMPGGTFADCVNLKQIVSHIARPKPVESLLYAGNGVLTDYFGIYYNWGLYRDKLYDDAVLYVPRGTKVAYSNTEGWKLFKNIEEIDDGTIVEPEGDYLAVDDVTLTHDVTRQVEVGLVNETQDLTAFQFDVVMPTFDLYEYMKLAKNTAGNYDVRKGSRLAEDHSLAVSHVGLNRYRVVCMSLSNSVIEGSEGPLLTLPIVAGSKVPEGDYRIMIEDVLMTQTDGTKIPLASASFSVTVIQQSEGTPGDADGDGTIDVADVVAIVNYILGHSGASFVESAADVDGDGTIDVADVVTLVNKILNFKNQ